MNKIFNSVDETISLFITKLSESTGFKYLKSHRTLKKVVGSIVFEVLFFSSKWNEAGKSIEINADFCVSYKKYGAASTIHSIIAEKSFQEKNSYWFDISTEDKFEAVLNLFDKKLHATAVDLADRFAKDIDGACQYLLEEVFDDYNVALDFLDEMLGTVRIMYRIREISDSLSDTEYQQIKDYRNGARNVQWMLNRCDLHHKLTNKTHITIRRLYGRLD